MPACGNLSPLQREMVCRQLHWRDPRDTAEAGGRAECLWLGQVTGKGGLSRAGSMFGCPGRGVYGHRE
eukprot:11302221-Prorocentrum_lima.AAC.1